MPQGSILRLILFLLFVNGLPLFLDYCSYLFPGDTATHIHIEVDSKIENKTQYDFNNSGTWMNQNQFVQQYNKTHCMSIGTRQNCEIQKKQTSFKTAITLMPSTNKISGNTYR